MLAFGVFQVLLEIESLRFVSVDISNSSGMFHTQFKSFDE